MYITTNIGNFKGDIVKYLVQERVLVYAEGNFYISGFPITDSEFRRPLNMWCLLNLVVEDVQNSQGIKRFSTALRYIVKNKISIKARGRMLAIDKIQSQKRSSRKSREYEF